MNYYQITPDIDFTDETFLSPVPSNNPSSDEDDDPNWLVLTSSKKKPSLSPKKSQNGNIDHEISFKSTNAFENRLHRDDDVKQVAGRNDEHNLIDNSPQRIGISSSLHVGVGNSDISENEENGNVACSELNVVMRRKKDKTKFNVDYNQTNCNINSTMPQYDNTNSLNNNCFPNISDINNSESVTSSPQKSNRLSKILDGVASYAASYMYHPSTAEENTSNLISWDNDNIFTTPYCKQNANSNYECPNNNFRNTLPISAEVPPLVLSDLSPEENPIQEDSVTRRIDELFDSLKPTKEDEAYNYKKPQQNSVSCVVRRRQKHGRENAYVNHRKSLGEELVNISTRKLQTVSGYFGDWTKWLRTAEEELNEAEFHQKCKLNVGQQSYGRNTNFEGIRTMHGIIPSNSLNNAAAHQRHISSNKKG